LGQKTFPEQLDDPSIFIASCGPFEIASNKPPGTLLPEAFLQDIRIIEMADSCSNLRTTVKSKAPRTWVITSVIIVGITLLCFALGIPTKDEEKINIRKPTALVMPFNFANDKFTEFKYFVKTIQQQWRTKPEELLNLQEYVEPDKYGHSGYAIEDSDLLVEFYYFENKLCQSTISIKDSGEAKKWAGHLNSKFGEKKSDGKYYSWNRAPLRILYETESGIHRFHFLHMDTFLAEQEHRKKIDQNLTRFMEFQKVVDNKVNWNSTPESLPDLALYEKKKFQKWDVYTHNKTTNLAYHFFQNRLCGIDFLIWDPKQAKKMHGLLQTKFGRGENQGNNGTIWDLARITIISKSYAAVSSFVFRHQETWTQKEKYAKK
jgi:hypothetical protein